MASTSMATPDATNSMNLPTNLPADGETQGVPHGQELPNGHAPHSNAETNSNSTHDKYGIALNEDLAFTPRKLRVITIGAGFSGLLMAHKLQHRFPEMQDIVEHTIFESREDMGGTWLVNHYPGVQCDVPSHIYAFPFDPKPDWSHFYSSGPEIQDYILETARKWNLDRDVQLNTSVVGTEWMQDEGFWKVTIEKNGQRRTEDADVLISGQGVLLHPSWPDIPGLQDFKGHVTHSAHWKHDYDYRHKRIAVIGNGSSGIQIVPQLAKLEGTTVTNFIRGPTWVYYRVPPSKHLGRAIDDPNPAYTEDEKKNFREHPEEHHKYRKGMIARTNKAFRMFIKGSDANNEAMKVASEQMAEKLGHNDELCRKLIPTWEVGCRRITPGPGYLESFTKDNCHVVNTGITRISENAIHTADGQVHGIDVLVCATGFDVSHRPRYPFIGKGGVNLREKWKDEAESYMSVAVSDMPNYFMMIGPNAVVGHGSLVEAINWTGDYIVKWLKKIASEDIKCVVPKAEVVDAFVKYSDEIMKTLVWTGDCKSWYKKNRVDGRVTALFGGSTILYKQLINQIRGEDFDIEYRSPNPWRFLGNGFTQFEMDDRNDLSWYVEEHW